MVKPWVYQTPDARLRNLNYARKLEEERAARLQEQETIRQDDVRQDFERERQRGIDLDQQGTQPAMQFEQARRSQLDRQEVRREDILPVPGDPTHEPGGRMLERQSRLGIGAIPTSPSGLKEMLGRSLTPEQYKKFGHVFTRQREMGLADLERTNQRRTALGQPPLTEEEITEQAWQRAIADVTSPAPSAVEFLGGGALRTAELFGGIAHAGLREVAGAEAQIFIPEALRGGEVSPGGVLPTFLVPPPLRQEVSEEPFTETLERMPRPVQIGLESAALAPFFGPGLAAEIGMGQIVGGEIGERTPIGRTTGEMLGLVGGPLASRAVLGPAVRGLTSRTPGAVKPMSEADVLGARGADLPGRARAVDIPAGARGTAGELQASLETAAQYGAKPWAGTAVEGFAAGLREPDIIVGGALTRLTTIIKQLKPLRAETEVEKSAAIRKKVGEVRGIQEQRMGEAGFYQGRAALRGPDLPARPSTPEPGGMVWARDRNNLGRVQSVSEDGRTAEVFFRNRETGAKATVTLDTSLLTPVGGNVRGQFSQIEIDSMIDHALKHPAANARPLEAENARAALIDTLGGKLPTQGEIALLERYFSADLAKAIHQNRPLGARAWEAFVDTINLPRTLMASYDVSFPFRQGIMVAARHPKEWLGNLPNMFRGGFSSRRAHLIDEAMSADATIIQTTKGPRAISELAADSGLYRAPIGGYGPLMEREEFFLSNLAKRIPLIGRGVRFSEQAFITYGNKLRQDIFKNTLQSWAKGDKAVTLEDTKALANLLNRMTGRGTLGPANQYAPLLSAGFFAPRFALSRPQAFMQLFNYKNPRVAALAAQEIVSFVALGTSVLSLVKLSGVADVELDPRSADFGKVKIGNTRIDFWGGNLQWARVVTQLQQQKRKTSTGVVVPASGIDAALRFLRFKGSPPASALVDWSLGETAVGEVFPPTGPGVAGEGDITTSIFRRMAPMAIQDLVEAILEHDATGGFLGALAFGGMGVQTYETRAQAFERVTGKSYDETPAVLRRQIIAQTPELQRFEADEPTESEEIRMERSQELLPGAQAVLQDLPDAGVAYTENRRGTMAKSAGAGEWAFRDLDIKPIGRDNELMSEYHNVDFMADRNENGVPGDEEDWRLAIEEREGILKQMSPPVQDAIQNPANFFPDADVVEVETMRNSAIDAIQEVVAIPKYQDLNVEEGEAIDEFREEVRQETAQIKREAKMKGYDPDNITFKMVAAHRVQEDRSLADLAAQAIMAERGDAPLTEERVDKALEHQEVLSIFYPRFLASVLPVAVERHERLSQEAFERINR